MQATNGEARSSTTPRLIDANALKDKSYETGRWMPVRVVNVEDIDAAPTVEAQPVRHGRWIPKYVGAVVTKFQCSECPRTVEVANDYFGKPTKFASSKYPYCHCGTKMDLEVQDEQPSDQ